MAGAKTWLMGGGRNENVAALVAPALEALRIDRSAHQHMGRGRARAAAEQSPEQVVHGSRLVSRQRRLGGAPQGVRQGSGSAWAVGAIDRAGRRVGSYCHRSLPAQSIGTNAKLSEDMGSGGNMRQGMQQMVEPHIRGAVEMRHIVGAVAARQHQLVDRDRISVGRGSPSPSVCECRARRAQIQITPLVRHRLAPPNCPRRGMHPTDRGAACHCVMADIGKVLPAQ